MKKRIISLFTTMLMVFGLISVMPTVDVYATQNRAANFSKSFTITGNGADDIINVARAQLGKTGSALGYSEQWCADFVGDCAALANQSSAIPRNGYCPSLQTAILNAGGSQVSINSAKKGDIAFYGSGGADHVEIVYANNNGRISTIGGNSGSGSSLYSRMVRDHSSQTMTITKVFRPNYKIAYSSPPSNLSITTNQQCYSVGESVTFSFTSSNETELYIPIDYNGKRTDFINVTGRTTYTCSFDKPGVYGFFLYGKNLYGESSTVNDYKQIRVYDSSPKDLSISTNKKIYYLNEEVNFKFISNNTDELYLPIDINGKRKYFIDVNGKTSYKTSFGTTGQYGYFLYGKNCVGESSSDYYTYYVFNKPNLGNEFYAKIRVKEQSQYLLTNVSDDLILLLENNDKGLEQTFKFKLNSDGSYRITSLSTGNAIDLEDYKDVDWGNVALHKYANTTNQNWNIYELEKNVYSFKPQCSNTRVLDVPYEKFENGASIKLHEFLGSAAQKFTIEKVSCPHKYVESVVSPTETSQGYTEYKCSVCGDTYKDNFVDPIKAPEVKLMLQKSVDGKYGRFILQVKIEDMVKADTVSYSITANGKTATTNLNSFYSSYKLGSQLNKAPEGYGYVISEAMYGVKTGDSITVSLNLNNFNTPYNKTITVK